MTLLLFSIVGSSEALAARQVGGEADREPEIVWDYACDGCSFDGVVVGGGRAFGLDRKGKIHALDASEGDPLWMNDRGKRFSYSFGLALAKRGDFEAVVLGCDEGLQALDPATGELLWRTDLPKGAAGPAIAEDLVIAASPDGQVYCCDLETGKLRWQHGYLEDRPEDPPGFDGQQARFEAMPARPGGATTDGKIVVFSVFDQCRAIALDVGSGERLWDCRTQGWVFGTPTIGAQNVFVGSQDRHVYAVDKRTGELRWKFQTGARVEGSVTEAGGHVYFGSCDAFLYSLNATSGETVWRLETEHEEGRGAPIYSRPVVLDDTVYLGALRGKVYAADVKTGGLRWKGCPMKDSEINSDLAVHGDLLMLTTRMGRQQGESVVIAIDRR